MNGKSFLGVVHSDAANGLRAQSCMVMKIKDIGKLPYSRVTAYSQTKWYPTSQERLLQIYRFPESPPLFASSRRMRLVLRTLKLL